MGTSYIELAGGAFLLGILHALIPNHWIPFVVLGHQRGWSTGRMVFVTFLGGTFHMASTILIGVVIGFLGIALRERYEEAIQLGAPLILMAAGLYILFRGHRHLHGRHAHVNKNDTVHSVHRSGEHHDHDEHEHRHVEAHAVNGFTSSDMATAGALLAIMFFSPCVELEAYYFFAAQRGWIGIGLVSLIYLVVTTSGLMILVALSAKGLERVRWPFLERYEAALSGGVLILLGLAWFFFPFEAHHH